MKEHNLGEQVLKDTKVKDQQTKSERSVSDLAKSSWDAPPPAQKRDAEEAPLAKQEARPHQPENASLVEASKRIKLLNNELHKPGGPLANSDLELVGFDKSGRLLMIHRDGGGKVDRKFLVDGESGRIVARTKPEHLDQWEKSRAYDRSAPRHPADWKAQQSDGATIWRDPAGYIRDVARANGDSLSVSIDKEGRPTHVKLEHTHGGRAGTEEWDLEHDGKVTSHKYFENPPESPKSLTRVDILSDGTLQITDEENELRRSVRPGGAEIHQWRLRDQWLPIGVTDPYGDSWRITRDANTGAPQEISLVRANGSTEVYKPGTTVSGVKQELWFKQPYDPAEPGAGCRFQAANDGALTQYIRRDEYLVFGTDGSKVSNTPSGRKILRPAYHAREERPRNYTVENPFENLT